MEDGRWKVEGGFKKQFQVPSSYVLEFGILEDRNIANPKKAD